jgi:DNA gyrase subunit A
MLFTRDGKGIRFEESSVNPQASGSATGVAAMKLGKGDAIIAGGFACGDEKEQSVLIVSEKGFAKRVELSEFPIQGRAGQGVQTLKITSATGKVAAAGVVSNNSSANIMSGQGRRYHDRVAEFPPATRVNRGEQIIDFGKDDTIQKVIAY